MLRLIARWGKARPLEGMGGADMAEALRKVLTPTVAPYADYKGITQAVTDGEASYSVGTRHPYDPAHNPALSPSLRKVEMNRITTTIQRQFLAEIVAGTNTIEYREIKPYWTEKFRKIFVPFELRLINGMSKTAPEITVLINEISKGDEWELHIEKVLDIRNGPIQGS